jgi:hypothetical protein
MVTLLSVLDKRSDVIHRRPILCATATAVPDPAKRSTTSSSGLLAMWMMRSRSASGLGVVGVAGEEIERVRPYGDALLVDPAVDGGDRFGTVPVELAEDLPVGEPQPRLGEG